MSKKSFAALVLRTHTQLYLFIKREGVSPDIIILSLNDWKTLLMKDIQISNSFVHFLFGIPVIPSILLNHKPIPIFN